MPGVPALNLLGANTDDADKDKLALQVDFQTLPDGTSYAAIRNLNVAAKQILVKISGSDYQKLAK